MRTRREFLEAMAIASASPFTLPLDKLWAGPGAADKCIDAHVHVWTPDTAQFPLDKGFSLEDMQPKSFTPPELFVHSRPAGVDRIVLIQMSFYRFDNRYMLSVIEQHPGVFAGVAIVDEDQANLAEHMKRLRSGGVRGFRLYADKSKAEAWSKSAAMKAMWSHAADLDQAMCLLANPDALPTIQAMCREFPKTKVVIDHFARVGMSGPIQANDLDNLCRLSDHEKVFVKTSAFYALGKKKPPYTDLVPMIVRLVQEFGSDRLMWASDCPYQVQGEHDYASSIGLVRDHLPSLSDAQRRDLLANTAERLFFA